MLQQRTIIIFEDATELAIKVGMTEAEAMELLS